jgi:IS30 family transposase
VISDEGIVPMPGRRLSFAERKVIENCLVVGLTQQQIAAVLGRSPSTICRELARNHNWWQGPSSPLRHTPRSRQLAAYRYCYRATGAQRRACTRARRPKTRRLADPRLWQRVTDLLRQDWSPQQIAAMLPRMFPDQPDMRVSHETIYRTLFVQTRGQLRRELTAHLRTGRTHRKPRGSGTGRHGPILAPIPISARPASIEDRAVPGHWEGDLLLGAPGQGAVLTLVERTSRYVLLAPLPHRHTAELARDQLIRLIGTLPAALRRSLTYDRGSEMAYHAEFSIATRVIVYFCDPHSPWQRGSNENTNGLLRQYWPKGADLRQLTQADCDHVAHRLNTRPRRTLNWQTPTQALQSTLKATTH